MASSQAPTSITPASLYSLAIFNPSLGTTDETLSDQIVFWTSRSPTSQNDCLRQIGLAQGIIEFSRGFSGSQDLSAVETQKSRIVLHELEPGWWILASVDLTQIHYATDPPSTDYSPREVAPSSVLISQLKTSHRQFILFNGSFDHILSFHGRDVLVQRLEKFYTRWAWQWEVMLSGNPAVDVWNGIKIGRGVGEEEKEVLGGFADRNKTETDGSERLIDIVVSRFGKPLGDEKDSKKDKVSKPGFSSRGTGRVPGPDDGCIYRGVGNLAKESVRDLAEWMSRWYQYGDSSFDYMTARPSRKKARRGKSKRTGSEILIRQETTPNNSSPSGTGTQNADASTSTQAENTEQDSETRLPPPLFPREAPQETQAPAPKPKKRSNTSTEGSGDPQAPSASGTNTLMLNVLTLGTYAAYSAWNRNRDDDLLKPVTPEPLNPELNTAEASGRFIIGYTGDLEEEDEEDDDGQPTQNPKPEQKGFISSTIWIQRSQIGAKDSSPENLDQPVESPELEECRLVAYAAYPFIFALLFHSSNDSLNKASFYRALHYQLGPLKSPLLASSENQYQPSNNKGVYDLIFDPASLTVHTSLPSIPEPVFNSGVEVIGIGRLPRIEALHVHSQIIRVIEDTRWKNIPLGLPSGEKERTNRTSRGWWIAWMRLEGVEVQAKPSIASSATQAEEAQDPAADESANPEPAEQDIASFIGSVTKSRRGRREAFIIRKGSEHRTHSRAASKDLKSGFGIPIKLTEGLGIDTKRYFDQLLNLTART